jgi:phosphatidate cytidylyltransferase
VSNLLLRTLVGLIFSLVVVGSAFAGLLPFTLLFGFFAAKGFQEFVRLVNPQMRRFQRRAGLGLAIVLYMTAASTMVYGTDWRWMLVVPVLWLLFLSVEMMKVSASFILDTSTILMGLIYTVLPFALLVFLGEINCVLDGKCVVGQEKSFFDARLPFGFFLILWANDTGAYLIGKFFGKHKLLEAVSPKKTWEGLFGGMASAILSGYFLYSLMPNSFERSEWVAIAAIVAVFANVGDLIESQIKRVNGVKDSGRLLPGHGGVLDRFDGLLIALPLVIIYLIIF